VQERLVVMNVFVTGATGVVGRRLIPMLRSAGHQVTGVARSPIGRESLERQGATAIDVDLFEPAAVLRAVTGKDAVINLATHIPHSSAQILLPWAWRENDRLRQVASSILVDACHAANVERFVQESFAPVYPDRGDEWIDETVAIRPVKYNMTVADAESSAQRFARSGRVGIVLRFGAFYGPDAFQMRDFVAWLARGFAPMPGPTTAYISSISHDDAATATAASLALPSGTYNVVDDRPVTHGEYFESLAADIGASRPKFLPTWLTPLFGSLGQMAARSLRMSNRKLRTASTWVPQYPSVREGWPAVLAQMGQAGSSAGKQASVSPRTGAHQ
jgi:nucleoside-diphosphate-sugar epimerase